MKTKFIIKSLALIVFLHLVFFSCQKEKSETSTEEFLVEATSTASFPVEFNSLPPKDLDLSASDSMLVKYAWEHFLALNWKSSYDSDQKRDNPDLNWSWNSDTNPYPDLVVWETYAHRTELRPWNNDMRPFDSQPYYSFKDQINKADPDVSLTLFNNLDENSEIGSCDVYAHYDKYKEEIRVLYQAKVNRDEYDYILNNYADSVQLKAAVNKKEINLPAGGDIGPDGQPITGTIEIKTAWRQLVQEDDASKFFTRDVLYYDLINNQVIAHNGKFALIGIHIIHKSKSRPDFVFATWEHNGVENDNMAYVLLSKPDVEIGEPVVNYKRLHPITDLVNRANSSVQEQIREQNPNSIWQNYRLVGVQGAPTNDRNSFNYYLANYVVESDSTLANFYGSSIGKPHDSLNNTSLNGNMFNMGGCMGCHGVAQRGGTDFSFLLDFGAGKPVKRPDYLIDETIVQSKLDQYINYLNKE